MGAGLSSCLAQGRLASEGRALAASLFDIDALRVVEHAIANKQSVLLCPADPLFPLPALIAAAAHIDAMVRERISSGRSQASPLRIAVVTRDYHLRGFYRGLSVRYRPGSGSEPLRAVVPAATVGPNGVLSVIDRDDGFWSTVFVESVAAAAKLPYLDLLIVDTPCSDADHPLTANVPTVVVVRDPADATALKAATRMATFAYDWALTGADTEAVAMGSRSARVANRACGKVEIVPVQCESMCANAALFWNDVPYLVRLSRRLPFVRALVTDAFALFHDLLGLALPLDAYEQFTGDNLRRRVDSLARSARIVADRDLREEWLPMIEAELSGMLDALCAAERDGSRGSRYATKAALLEHVVAEELDNGKNVLVIARTASLARAYEQHLHVRWPKVRVTSIGELVDVAVADVAVLPGMAPTWGRWVYRSGIAPVLKILAYSDGPGSGVAAVGSFDEVSKVSESISMQAAAAAAMSSPRQRERAWAALRSRTSTAGAVSLGDLTPGTGIETRTRTPPEVPPGLWSGWGWTAAIEPQPSGSSLTTSRERCEVAPGLRVEFDDGTWTWLHENSVVWRWRPNTGRSEPVEARSLAIGHDLVFIDDDASKSLLGKVLEVSAEVPALAVAGAWVGQWRACLHRAHRKYGTYAGLGRALSKIGCTVQTQTVRLWCLGETIGPDDPNDVYRVARIADDQTLLGNGAKGAQEVLRAIRTLRGAHSRLKNRLAVLARRAGPAAAQGHLRPDEVLDERSGLTAADIESAVAIVTVVRIERADAVPRLLVGRRRRADEPIDLIRISDIEEQH